MKHSRIFTLLEVVIAIAILAGSLSALLAFTVNSQNRLQKSKQKWLEFHLLEQAAEFYLLTTDREPEFPPDFIFSNRRYTVECFYTDPDDIPEDFQNSSNSLKLINCHIQLIDTTDNKTVHEIIVEKPDYVSLEAAQ